MPGDPTDFLLMPFLSAVTITENNGAPFQLLSLFAGLTSLPSGPADMTVVFNLVGGGTATQVVGGVNFFGSTVTFAPTDVTSVVILGDPLARVYGVDNINVVATQVPVPEPATLSLLGIGLAGLGARRWRQRRNS